MHRIVVYDNVFGKESNKEIRVQLDPSWTLKAAINTGFMNKNKVNSLLLLLH